MTEAEQQKFYKMLGTRIREARLKANLKQAAFASFLNLSRASIVNIEKGRQHPPIHLLWVISNVLKIEVATLLPHFDYTEKLDPKWEKLLSKQIQDDDGSKVKLLSFLEEVQSSKS